MITFTMTRKQALELGFVVCQSCGYPPSSHFDHGNRTCAHTDKCTGYVEAYKYDGRPAAPAATEALTGEELRWLLGKIKECNHGHNETCGVCHYVDRAAATLRALLERGTASAEGAWEAPRWIWGDGVLAYWTARPDAPPPYQPNEVQS